MVKVKSAQVSVETVHFIEYLFMNAPTIFVVCFSFVFCVLSCFCFLIRSRGPGYLFALFSNVLGPLGSLFAALGALLAALGRLLGAFWVPFGRSWPPLGRSWALLGSSWEALGRSWVDLGATCKNH